MIYYTVQVAYELMAISGLVGGVCGFMIGWLAMGNISGYFAKKRLEYLEKHQGKRLKLTLKREWVDTSALATIRCFRCGKPVSLDSNFCPYCAVDLRTVGYEL